MTKYNRLLIKYMDGIDIDYPIDNITEIHIGDNGVKIVEHISNDFKDTTYCPFNNLRSISFREKLE